jgi:hypothetical protein
MENGANKVGQNFKNVQNKTLISHQDLEKSTDSGVL